AAARRGAAGCRRASISRPRAGGAAADLEGLDNREISTRLHIAEKTVKVHIGRIYQKLGAQGRAQALVLAARAGMVSLAPTDGRD
ncbi:protein containing Transcription regulator LuxR, partial [mine drainage metagenome]